MWFREISKDSDVVISTRIRYARSIEGYKFPNIMTKVKKEEILDRINRIWFFNKLSSGDIKRIIQRKLKEKMENYPSLKPLGDDLIQEIKEKSNYKVYGASRIDQLIEREITSILVDMVV